jgi:hypothetical protein
MDFEIPDNFSNKKLSELTRQDFLNWGIQMNRRNNVTVVRAKLQSYIDSLESRYRPETVNELRLALLVKHKVSRKMSKMQEEMLRMQEEMKKMQEEMLKMKKGNRKNKNLKAKNASLRNKVKNVKQINKIQTVMMEKQDEKQRLQDDMMKNVMKKNKDLKSKNKKLNKKAQVKKLKTLRKPNVKNPKPEKPNVENYFEMLSNHRNISVNYSDEENMFKLHSAIKKFTKKVPYRKSGYPTLKQFDSESHVRIYPLYDNGVYNRMLDNVFSDEPEVTYEEQDISDQTERITGAFIPDRIEIVFPETKMINEKPVDISKWEIVDGEFFPFVHDLDVDLTRFQIFNDIKPEYFRDNCFVYACEKSGRFTPVQLDFMRTIIQTRKIPSRLVKIIARDMNADFRIRKYTEADDKVRIKIDTRGKKTPDSLNTKPLDLLLYKGHYMLWEKVAITTFYLKNREQLDKDFPNDVSRFSISQLHPIRHSTTNILHILKNIFKFNHFRPISQCEQMILRTPEHCNSLVDYSDLNYDEELCTKKITPNHKKEQWSRIYYADFETDTSVNPHLSYMCCVVSEVDEKHYTKSFIDNNPVRIAYDFLNYLQPNSLTYFHNLKYDACFFMKESEGYDVKILERNGTIIQLTLRKNAQILTFRNSYSIIPAPLRKFSEMFGLKVSKEIMPYKFYNYHNRTQKIHSVTDFLDAYMSENPETNKTQCKNQILRNARTADALLENPIDKKPIDQNPELDIMKYAEFYCMRDCIVLMRGIQSFDKDLQDVCGIGVHKYLSISSIGYAFCINYGCLDGVYALSGKPQNFIQRCVNGGRCMIANNEKVIVDDVIQDFDAVSLYPSAMSVMTGIPIGKPKILDANVSLEKLMSYSQFFIEISITSLKSRSGKPYNFPLVFKKLESGVKQYVNECVDSFYVDKRSLLDLEEFYDIEYEVKRGYYFDEGFNNKINEFIVKLFELRLKYKSEHNPLENTIKLLLNSIYGKSILKNIATDNIVVPKDKLDKYIIRYYNYIQSISLSAYSDKAFVKRVKSVAKHFNVPQFGVTVLSWSKHLMNRVICTAEQHQIPIFYTDTDSIHIRESDIQNLATIFKGKYNQELIGKKLTQYHTDFTPINDRPTHSTKLIALGKKSYIDVLENDLGETAYHIRMKSIPEKVLLKYCEKNKLTALGLYQNLYNGEQVEFDLTEGCNCFKKTKCYEQVTLDKFKRNIKF